MVVMGLAAHLVTRRRARHFHRHQPAFVGQGLYGAIDRRDPQSGHLLLRQMQHLIGRQRTIVSLEDLAYFTALLGVPAKGLLRSFRSIRTGHNVRIGES